MNIGIITFHWATNYGAILQSYALQEYLKKFGHNVKIIDYVPNKYEKTFMRCFKSKNIGVIKNNVGDYQKEKEFKKFREQYLNLTKRYKSFKELENNPPQFDIYICGSDQIWNQYFTANGEGCFTPSYFLDFVDGKVNKLAYAVSFGTEDYPDELITKLKPVVSKFNAISVRENSGVNIVKRMGVDNVCLMPDPSILIGSDVYTELIGGCDIYERDYVFFYGLHSNQNYIKKIKKYFENDNKYNIIDTNFKFNNKVIDIKMWLSYIKNSKLVVTNSYHGVLFSIIFKVPFVVVLTEGGLAGMNDRLFTLLDRVDMKDRILDDCGYEKIMNILGDDIDWDSVYVNVDIMRGEALSFFKNNLKL